MLPNLPPLAHIGHATAQEALEQLVADNRLPHALLLHGPQGVGKAQLALRLAFRVLCPPQGVLAPEPLAHDEAHPLFPQLVAEGSVGIAHLAPLDGKKSIGVEQVRSALEKLTLTADHARFVIVDSADDLSSAAANALLKQLEEPNAGIYFILLSHRMSGLLPTIVSRCRRLHCGTLSPAETTQILQQAGQNPAEFSSHQIARGTPGQLLEPGEDPLPAWENWLQQPNTVPPSGDAVQGLDALAQALAQQAAQQPTYACLYSQVLDLQQQQQTLNLPAQVVLEKLVADVRGS